MNTSRLGMIAATAVLSVAALLFVAALARALTTEPRTPPGPEMSSPADTPVAPAAEPTVPSQATLSGEDITLAVDLDPFLPDRRRPEPYRLPGEDVFDDTELPELPPAPDFRVTGTVVMGDAGHIVIEVDGSPPLVLGMGESLMGYRLESVGATSATMVGGGRTLDLALAAASPNATDASRQGGSTRESQLNAQLLRSLQQRFGEGFAAIVERAQTAGSDPMAIQSLLRMMQSGGRGRGEAAPRVIIRRDTSDVPLRTPDLR